MKQGSSFKGRPRGRNNNYRSNNNNSNNNNRRDNNRTSFDSSSPIGKIRGNASQVMDKYLLAAKDALSRGERLLAEQCSQYAEHYYRVQNQGNNNNSQNNENANNVPEVSIQKEASTETSVQKETVEEDSAQKETAAVIAEPEKNETQEEKPKRIRRTRKVSKAKTSKAEAPKTLGEMLPKAPETEAEAESQNEKTDLNFSWNPSDIGKKASIKEAEAIN